MSFLCVFFLYASNTEIAMQVLLFLKEKKWTTPKSIIDNSKLFQANIDDYKEFKANSGEIITICEKLVNEYEGKVPSTYDNLWDACGDSDVAMLMMQYVFGSTRFPVSLHLKKIAVALDLFDWEETGLKVKSEVKMVNIISEHVRLSFMTFLPKGEGIHLYELMDALGTYIGRDARGTWGTIMDTCSAHFSTSEKKLLKEMAAKIVTFYKCIKKSRGRKRKKTDEKDAAATNEMAQPSL